MKRRRGYDRSLRNPPPVVAAMRYAAGLRLWLDAWHEHLIVALMASYRDPLGRAVGALGGMPRSPRLDARLPRFDPPEPPSAPIRVIERASADVVAHVDKGLRRVYDVAGRYLGRKIPDGPRPGRVQGIQLRAAAPKVADQLPAFRKANVELITSIPRTELSEMQGLLDQAWIEGKHPDETRKLIEERFDVSKSRADLIARDQTLKLNANVTQARHQALGIVEYTWSTSGDERVRPMHSDLDGSTQKYDDPPETDSDGSRNHPGEDVQCRCVAIPILPTLDDDEA